MFLGRKVDMLGWSLRFNGIKVRTSFNRRCSTSDETVEGRRRKRNTAKEKCPTN